MASNIPGAHALLSHPRSAASFPPAGHDPQQIGAATLESANPFLERIAAQNTMGGWVVIAGVLNAQQTLNLPGAIAPGGSFHSTKPT